VLFLESASADGVGPRDFEVVSADVEPLVLFFRAAGASVFISYTSGVIFHYLQYRYCASRIQPYDCPYSILCDHELCIEPHKIIVYST